MASIKNIKARQILDSRGYPTVECDIIFDASLFSTKVDGDVKDITGLDKKIQLSIINHPRFDIIIDKKSSKDTINR